jgi:hypothetical protein
MSLPVPENTITRNKSFPVLENTITRNKVLLPLIGKNYEEILIVELKLAGKDLFVYT